MSLSDKVGVQNSDFSTSKSQFNVNIIQVCSHRFRESFWFSVANNFEANWV